MSYNPAYGGQFRGLQAASQRNAPANTWKKDGGGAARGSNEETDPGEKVIVTLGSLKQVKLDEIGPEDERYFIVVGLFEGDDLNTIVNHTQNRTAPVKGQLVAGSYTCSFGGAKIVLNVKDPSKRFILYVCVVTIKKGTDEQGKTFKDIALMGIGFSQPFEVRYCKKYHHTSCELRLVEGGDPSISPGKLDTTVNVCKRDQGGYPISDVEENIMVQFQT